MSAKELVRAALLRGERLSWSDENETEELIPEQDGKVTLFYTWSYYDGGGSGTTEYDSVDIAVSENEYNIDKFADGLSPEETAS